MSNKSLALWSIGLTLPVQYVTGLSILLLQVINSGGGEFGCSNFHEAGLTPCSFGAMLMNPLFGVFLFNVLSYGMGSVFVAVLIGVVLWSGRAIRRGALRRT